MPTYLVVQTLSMPKMENQRRERLVEAKNKPAAIRYIADETIHAVVADIADAMRLAKAGVTVEKAGE